MTKIVSCVRGIAVESFDYHKGSPSSVFKLFVSVVLVMFAFLSLVSISTNNAVNDLAVLERTFRSVHYWWGLLGLFGAASLIFERYIKDNFTVTLIGYVSAISSFALLSYDFITTKPPVLTGGILAATAVIFLGGLLYGRVKRKQQSE